MGPEEAEDAWLMRDPLPADPLPWLARWLDEAFEAGVQRNPHAMTLATVDPDGRPSARIVLCKGIDVESGQLRFFTNRESRKGLALAARPQAALVFYWGAQERQARVEGAVEILPDAESDAYFASRPRDSRIGARASAQSRPVASRAVLEERIAAEQARFGPDDPMDRPASWGGYRVVADCVELWRSRPARIHDRARWTRTSPGSPWTVERLQP